MATDAQTAANRRNAKRSTGPRTGRGKAIAARNALRHGLLAQDVILDDEDASLFEERRDAICARLDARGELEDVLVERIVACAWRLRRLERIEASVFQYHVLDRQVDRARTLATTFTRSIENDLLGIAMPTITEEQQHTAAQGQLDKAVAARDRETLAIAFSDAAASNDTLAKLSRHEVAIERSFYRRPHRITRTRPTCCRWASRSACWTWLATSSGCRLWRRVAISRLCSVASAPEKSCRESYEDGRVSSAACDENGDGRPDRRLIYTGGALVAIESQPDEDGYFRTRIEVGR